MTPTTPQIEFRRRLNEELLAARLKNPGYSLRAFARKLGISSAALSEILNGKRSVSQKLALRVADRLAWSPDQRAGVVALPRYQKKTDAEPVQLTMDHFQAVSDWYHFAILSLAETVDFDEDAAWIAHRLNISRPQARAAVERLERLGMLERNPAGKLMATGASYASSDEIVSLALRKSHAQNIELARRSLEEDPIEKRDFTAVTMAIDPARLGEAKRRIRAFRDELSAYLEGGVKKEVYKFCLNLIPLSKSEENQ
jgi:plasmid maintenance system antidote protein VapI